MGTFAPDGGGVAATWACDGVVGSWARDGVVGFYEAVLVSKLRSHFIVLILHFMLYFSHLMLNQLHFHTVLRTDSVRIHFVKVLWFFQ